MKKALVFLVTLMFVGCTMPLENGDIERNNHSDPRSIVETDGE